MIDKLDVRVPGLSPIAGDIEDSIRSALGGRPVPGIIPGGRYALRADLRHFGRHSMLHFGFKHLPTHPHKLEILDVGQLTFPEMLDEISSVFDVDPLQLEIMRVDYAVDIAGVPVSWFRDHVRGRGKQWTAGIYELIASDMGRKELQSFYLGKRPNCFRIYNKLKEQEKQYKDFLRQYEKERRKNFIEDWSRLKQKPEYPSPMSYAEMFPPIDSSILTRVERQIGGGRLPNGLSTVESLRATDFNPFTPIEIHGETRRMPTVEEVGLNRFVTGLGFHQLHRQLGEHRFRAFVNQHSSGNTSRVLREHGDFVYGNSEPGITNGYLSEMFRHSLQQQIAS